MDNQVRQINIYDRHWNYLFCFWSSAYQNMAMGEVFRFESGMCNIEDTRAHFCKIF